MNNQKEEKDRVEVDALCPECGLAFKTYVDRVVDESKKSDLAEKVECPVPEDRQGSLCESSSLAECGHATS